MSLAERFTHSFLSLHRCLGLCTDLSTHGPLLRVCEKQNNPDPGSVSWFSITPQRRRHAGEQRGEWGTRSHFVCILETMWNSLNKGKTQWFSLLFGCLTVCASLWSVTDPHWCVWYVCRSKDDAVKLFSPAHIHVCCEDADVIYSLFSHAHMRCRCHSWFVFPCTYDVLWGCRCNLWSVFFCTYDMLWRYRCSSWSVFSCTHAMLWGCRCSSRSVCTL